MIPLLIFIEAGSALELQKLIKILLVYTDAAASGGIIDRRPAVWCDCRDSNRIPGGVEIGQVTKVMSPGIESGLGGGGAHQRNVIETDDAALRVADNISLAAGIEFRPAGPSGRDDGIDIGSRSDGCDSLLVGSQVAVERYRTGKRSFLIVKEEEKDRAAKACRRRCQIRQRSVEVEAGIGERVAGA